MPDVLFQHDKGHVHGQQLYKVQEQRRRMAKKRTGLLPGLLLLREANGEASGSGQRAMRASSNPLSGGKRRCARSLDTSRVVVPPRHRTQ